MIAQAFAPRSVEELAHILAKCSAAGTALSIEGGGTLAGMGTACAAAAGLSCTKLDRVVAYEYQDLTCAVRSGMTLAHFNKTLAERGQFVPVDAPLRRKATVGGTMAAGWLGPRRHLYGRARDFVIGSQVVLADGTIANAGGMVVKNVSGYDMGKLYIGSFGTLAVLTQVNFKTMPLPPIRRALVAALPARTRARAIAQVAGLSVMPAAAYCIEGYRKGIDGEDGIDGRLYLLLEGSAPMIERATRDIRSALGRAGVPETIILDAGADESFERLLDAPIASIGERSVTYRSLGSAESGDERAHRLRDAANRRELFTDVLLDIMNGDVFLRLSERDSRALAQKIEPCDDDLRALDPGSIIVAGEAPIRSSLNGWGAPPPAIERMRALKAHFDPAGILNPGRFVGGI